MTTDTQNRLPIMDIGRKNGGDQIAFVHPTHGYKGDQELAAKHLRIGFIYTIERLDVHSASTTVYLVEVPNIPFNSVMFTDVPTVYLVQDEGTLC